MNKVIKITSIVLSASAVATAACIGLGYLLPTMGVTPFWLELSRKEYQNSGGDLLLGNEHLYFQSPLIASIGTPAWGLSDCLYGLKTLRNEGKEHQIHYEVYSEEERKENPKKEQVGFYALHNPSEERKPFVLAIAGGGFTSVCTPFESLPVISKFNELGYPAFALTYRLSENFGTLDSVTDLMDDINASVSYIISHADDFNIDPTAYYIAGFSAGAMTSSLWCLKKEGYLKYNLPAPKAACLMYGASDEMLEESDFVPTFTRFCKNDQYFSQEFYDSYVSHLESLGVPYDAKQVDCLHGFGLGTGTEAEGWVEDALKFFSRL